MIGFDLTEEQQALKEFAREFAEREIRPIAAELDRIENPEELFPWALLEKGSRAGLRTLALPKEYGGQDIDIFTQLVMIDELAFADSACAKIFSHVWKLSGLIAKAGTQEQRDRFLPMIRDDPSLVMSVAITEPDAGTDNSLPFDDPSGGLKLAAVRDGDHYVLNGTKQWISLGNVSKLLIVAARTDKTQGVVRGTSWFLVPSDTPGFSVDGVHDKVGWKAYPEARLSFNDVRVPAENLLGGVEGLVEGFALAIGHSELEVSAHMVAVARAAYEASLAYAKQRIQGGKPIIEHQAVALILGEMYVEVETARTYLWHVGRLAAKGQADPGSPHAACAKASEVVDKVTTGALLVHGGMGIAREMPIEKLKRDALVFLHATARHIQLLKLCRQLADR